MASTYNAFDFLNAPENSARSPAAAAAAAAKKGGGRGRKGRDRQPAPAPALAAEKEKDRGPVKSGAAGSDRPPAAAAAAQKGDKANHHNAATTSTEAPPAAPPAPASPQITAVPISAQDARTNLERLASSAGSSAERLKLWKDWLRQVQERPRKTDHKSEATIMYDIKQVFLEGQTLEITVQSCLSAPLTRQEETYLLNLLLELLSIDKSRIEAFVSAIRELSELAQAKANDTTGPLRRAVSQVVSHLKSSGVGARPPGAPLAAGDWLQRMTRINEEIVRKHGLLQALGQAKQEGMSKEQLSCAHSIFQLESEKLDLLLPNGLPGVPPRQSVEMVTRNLESLRQAAENHLKEAKTIAAPGLSSPQNQESQAFHTLAALHHAEMVLNDQIAEVASEIRALEVQLSARKEQAADLEAQQESLQHKQRMAMNSLSEAHDGCNISNNNLPGDLNAYEKEMAAVTALIEVVEIDHSRQETANFVTQLQANHQNSPLEYFAISNHYLRMMLSALLETPDKIAYCQQRVMQAEKLLQLGKSTGGPIKGSKKRPEKEC